MKLGAEDKKKARIAAVVGVVALGALAYAGNSIFGGATPPPPQAPTIVDITNHTATPTPGGTTRTVATPPGYAVAGAAEKVGTTSGQLDPTLHEEAMLNTESLIYSGTGRNIFSGMAEAPPPAQKLQVAKNNFPPRPPDPPRPPAGPIIIPPPPINLKFFGTITASGTGNRKAFLLGGDDVFLASQGDVVQRRYRVVSISASSVLIEDIANTNQQQVPLIPN